MARQIALLRGINVGGHNRIAMASLRELLGELGYGDVRTHLQSGNAVLSAPGSPPERTGREIEGRIARDLGLEVRVVVRTSDELAEAIEGNPLGELATDPARMHVTFLSAAPERSLLEELAPADFEPDVFAVGTREIYVWYPDGVRATRLTNAFWERRLGVTATARNWNTVTRLLALADE
jgi:uncharacterized protein (DUF1697 family)